MTVEEYRKQYPERALFMNDEQCLEDIKRASSGGKIDIVSEKYPIGEALLSKVFGSEIREITYYFGDEIITAPSSLTYIEVKKAWMMVHPGLRYAKIIKLDGDRYEFINVRRRK